MNYDPLLMVPLVLWLFTYGVTAVFQRIVKKKLGAQSEEYADFRLPYFLTNVFNSIVSVGVILYIMNRPVSPEFANYLAVPYFGVMAYGITSAFRALKEARNN